MEQGSRLFVAAPAGAGDAATELYLCLGSEDPAVRAAALAVIATYERPEILSVARARAKDWNHAPVRAIYREGLRALAASTERREAALRALAEELVGERQAGRRALTYQVFLALFDCTRDPGPVDGLDVRHDIDWDKIEGCLRREQVALTDAWGLVRAFNDVASGVARIWLHVDPTILGAALQCAGLRIDEAGVAWRGVAASIYSVYWDLLDSEWAPAWQPSTAEIWNEAMARLAQAPESVSRGLEGWEAEPSSAEASALFAQLTTLPALSPAQAGARLATLPVFEALKEVVIRRAVYAESPGSAEEAQLMTAAACADHQAGSEEAVASAVYAALGGGPEALAQRGEWAGVKLPRCTPDQEPFLHWSPAALERLRTILRAWVTTPVTQVSRASSIRDLIRRWLGAVSFRGDLG